ncbi:hypothetical protein AAMO2058_001315800 [Amorphochlora amoebiformis]
MFIDTSRKASVLIIRIATFLLLPLGFVAAHVDVPRDAEGDVDVRCRGAVAMKHARVLAKILEKNGLKSNTLSPPAKRKQRKTTPEPAGYFEVLVNQSSILHLKWETQDEAQDLFRLLDLDKVAKNVRVRVGEENIPQSKQDKMDGEERPAEWIQHPPQGLTVRIDRCINQAMSLLKTQIITPIHTRLSLRGSSGVVYELDINNTPSCTCPDFVGGTYPCKHLLYAFIKVLKVDMGSPLIYQRGLLSSEVEEITGGSA